MKKVLIAENECITAEAFKNIVKRSGHEVAAVAYSGEGAIKMTGETQPDVALLDINMEHRTAGIDACKCIKEKFPEIKVYFLSAYSREVYEQELANVQYDGYIDKLNFERLVIDLLG